MDRLDTQFGCFSKPRRGDMIIAREYNNPKVCLLFQQKLVEIFVRIKLFLNFVPPSQMLARNY